MASIIEGVKRKCTSFFKPDDRNVIKHVVEEVHSIVSEASMLLKAYYLHQYKQDPTDTVIVDEILLHVCCDIVRGDVKTRTRVTKVAEKPTGDDDLQKFEKSRKVKKRTGIGKTKYSRRFFSFGRKIKLKKLETGKAQEYKKKRKPNQIRKTIQEIPCLTYLITPSQIWLQPTRKMFGNDFHLTSRS